MTTDALHQRAVGRGFTLVEVIAVMAIVGAIAGVVTPLVVGSSENFSLATSQRAAASRVDYAMLRVTRSIRNAHGALGGGADITTAGDSRIAFGCGLRIELLGSTLWLTEPSSAAAPLCQSVDVFRIEYLGEDGVTDTQGAPSETRRLRLVIESGRFAIQTTVFLAQSEMSP